MVERKDEGIGEHASNGTRLDLRAFRRGTGSTFFLPISVKLAARCVFHALVAPARSRRDSSVPDWDRSSRVGAYGAGASRRYAATVRGCDSWRQRFC